MQKKFKNTILKGLGFGFGFLFLLSVSCLDGESMIPYATAIVSMLYLIIFGVANNVITIDGSKR